MTTTAPPATPQPILDLRKQLLAFLSAMCDVSLLWREWAEEMDMLLGKELGDPIGPFDSEPVTNEYTEQQWRIGGEFVLRYHLKVTKQITKTLDLLRGISAHLQYGMGSDAGPWETRAVKAILDYLDRIRELIPGDIFSVKTGGMVIGLDKSIAPDQVRAHYETFRRFYDGRWKAITSDLMHDLECCAVETAPESATDMPADQTSNESRGLALLMDNPNLDIKAIAALLSVKPRTPYKWADFMAAHRRIQQSKRRNLADGFRDDRTGGVEAGDE